MTRQEQIREAAVKYLEESDASDQIDFINGAYWADLNPDNQKIWDLIEDHKTMKQALEFWGRLQWDQRMNANKWMETIQGEATKALSKLKVKS